MEIGKHCAFPSCKQLDFLPFVCNGCKQIFCLDHRTYKDHKCTEFDESAGLPACPLCNQVIFIKKGDDPNRKVDEHISNGCPKEESSNPYYRCSYVAGNNNNSKKCKNTEVVPIICNSCNRTFCVSHRFPQDHECEKWIAENDAKNSKNSGINYSELRKAVQERIGNLIQQKNSEKPAAKKVNFMRMKTKAIGNANIPQEKRFYLEVVYPMESGVQPKLMFFNSSFSIGKVLDMVADAGNIENRNNQANAEKLHLISLKTGEPLPTSKTLAEVAELLASGDSVLLEKLENIQNTK